MTRKRATRRTRNEPRSQTAVPRPLGRCVQKNSAKAIRDRESRPRTTNQVKISWRNRRIILARSNRSEADAITTGVNAAIKPKSVASTLHKLVIDASRTSPAGRVTRLTGQFRGPKKAKRIRATCSGKTAHLSFLSHQPTDTGEGPL